MNHWFRWKANVWIASLLRMDGKLFELQTLSFVFCVSTFKWKVFRYHNTTHKRSQKQIKLQLNAVFIFHLETAPHKRYEPVKIRTDFGTRCEKLAICLKFSIRKRPKQLHRDILLLFCNQRNKMTPNQVYMNVDESKKLLFIARKWLFIRMIYYSEYTSGLFTRNCECKHCYGHLAGFLIELDWTYTFKCLIKCESRYSNNTRRSIVLCALLYIMIIHVHCWMLNLFVLSKGFLMLFEQIPYRSCLELCGVWYWNWKELHNAIAQKEHKANMFTNYNEPKQTF